MKPVAPEQVVLERSDLDDGLMFLGMVGLMDPPRPEAVDAVAECRAAGIQVKMITGDHAATALAIGRRIGLADTGRVLTGADLDRLDDAALQQSALETDVFARTSPEHKLRLVTALQARGLIVAMTGDGVNDAPALKRRMPASPWVATAARRPGRRRSWYWQTTTLPPSWRRSGKAAPSTTTSVR